MKQLRINGKNGSEIDFQVLETFTEQEWKDWIDSRMHGKDIYGFSVGGTHARVEPSEGFMGIRERIDKGAAYPNAEKAIVRVIQDEKIKGYYYPYTIAELTSIAREVIRPSLGYDALAEIVAQTLREAEKKTEDTYKLVATKNSLDLLVHMQKFEDTQFLDVYNRFLKPLEGFGEEYDRRNPRLYAFLGIQKSYELLKVDERSLRKILKLNNGDERTLFDISFCLGKIVEAKQDEYFRRIHERALQRETK